MRENEISKELVDIFIKVHSGMGPGLLESVYEEIICHELSNRKLNYKRQQAISVIYNNVKMEMGFRADIIVEDKVIVEIKSVESIASVHQKQLLTYLKLSEKNLVS